MSFKENALGKNWSDEIPYYTIIRGASKQFCYGARRRVKQRRRLTNAIIKRIQSV